MRAIIQRVTQASVLIDGSDEVAIAHGFMVLIGIMTEDGPADADWIVDKICQMRIFGDENGLMNISIKDTGGDILLISQFTLFASTKKGNRPSFTRSARPEQAIPLYEYAIQRMELVLGKKIFTGKFGADMKVSLTNDGPVTIPIDSKNKE